MNPRALVWLVVVVTAAFLIGLLYREEMQPPGRTKSENLPVASDCDPKRRPCLAGDASQGLTLFLPESARLMQPFPIQVQVHGMSASSVTVDFQMRGMEMGVNRVRLAPTDGESWRGSATLPVCVTGRADWLALVEAESDAGPKQATFEFSIAP